MTVSQISAGRKNRFFVEIYGSKGSVTWNQEAPDELWIGQRNTPNLVVVKDPSLLMEKARSYADLPGGHSEGYDDTFKQVFRRFYKTVADRGAAVEYPTFEDGLRQLRSLEGVLESSAATGLGGTSGSAIWVRFAKTYIQLRRISAGPFAGGACVRSLENPPKPEKNLRKPGNVGFCRVPVRGRLFVFNQLPGSSGKITFFLERPRTDGSDF